MFSKDDLQQIRERGSDPDVVQKQLAQFRTGFPYAAIIAPASSANGIRVFSDAEKAELAAFFDAQKTSYDICRFVPASGAATRMFKALFSVRDSLSGLSPEQQMEFVQSDQEAELFFNELDKYPFYEKLPDRQKHTSLEILNFLLDEEGLSYGSLPKGLIEFHRYNTGGRTAFEEHLHEAAKLLLPGTSVKLHFTVSEEHLTGFRELEKKLHRKIEAQYNISLEISYSFQKKETDTIAVDLKNQPFRDEGKLVFRPGGHGALIENLNDLDSEIIFISNIDNVAPDANSELRLLNKKVLAAVLLKARASVYHLLGGLESRDEKALENALLWLKEEAMKVLPDDFESWERERKFEWAAGQLDKPLRVCGMVKNEGDPGGGPFFVKNTRGETSLQIVEASQIDVADPVQSALFARASHFNPVDLVCSVSRPDGSTYHLPEYVDHDTGFISSKSVKGRDLKALELPGLWNGSMEGWNTIFVEIPGATFTPVKTIYDLIKPSHRG